MTILKKYFGGLSLITAKAATYFVSFLTIFMLVSCLDEVKVPLRQENEKLVIEGLITNEPNNQFLRLSFTTQFNNFGQIEPAKGAYVELRSSRNETLLFRPVPNELGVYRPDNNQFVGVVGVGYSIYIKLPDGREFISPTQTMPAPVGIDNLTAKFEEGQRFGFQIFLDFKDPLATQNFYRWTARGFHQRKSKGVPVGFGNAVCCDRCWVLKEEKSVNIFADGIANGGLIKARPVYFSPFYVLGKHLIEIQQYAISQEAYQFWSNYKDQQQRTGSIFDPLPAPLLGNVVNKADAQDIALGFFEVAAVSRKRIEPMAATQGLIAYNLDNPLYVPDGDCMVGFPFSVYISTMPSGW